MERRRGGEEEGKRRVRGGGEAVLRSSQSLLTIQYHDRLRFTAHRLSRLTPYKKQNCCRTAYLYLTESNNTSKTRKSILI